MYHYHYLSLSLSITLLSVTTYHYLSIYHYLSLSVTTYHHLSLTDNVGLARGQQCVPQSHVAVLGGLAARGEQRR